MVCIILTDIADHSVGELHLGVNLHSACIRGILKWQQQRNWLNNKQEVLFCKRWSRSNNPEWPNATISALQNNLFLKECLAA